VFGFYKDGDGYMSSGTTKATDFRPGQWMPHAPRVIKKSIERRGGFGVNGFYLPMNDSSNPGADFHCAPNSIITLKGEDLPQPRNGAPTTTDAYVSQLRSDPYAANLVLAVPGISTSTSATIVSNGHFDTDTTGWTVGTATGTLVAANGELEIQRVSTNGTYCTQQITTETGKRYTVSFDTRSSQAGSSYITKFQIGTTPAGSELLDRIDTDSTTMVHHTASFTATGTTAYVFLGSNYTANSFWDNIVIKQEDAPRDYSADIKGSGTNKTLTAAGSAGVGYELGNYYGSAMTFDGTGDYLSIASNADFALGTGDFTVECWAKFDTLTGISNLLSSGLQTGGWAIYASTLQVGFVAQNIEALSGQNLTTGQWIHIAAERYGTTLTVYVNGVASSVDTSFAHNITQNGLAIGAQITSGNDNTDGQIQDARIYKGVAKYKGGFDVPKPYTPVGFEGDSWRTTDDTCKNNFATLNPLDAVTSNQSGTDYTQATHSNGNLTVILSDDFSSARGSIGVSSGKYYWEVRLDANTNSPGLGVVAPGNQLTSYNAGGGGASYEPQGDRFRKNGVGHYDGTDNKTDDGLIVGVALDKDAGSISFYADGALLSNGTMTGLNDLSDVHIPECFTFNDGVDNTFTWNFGQNPSFSGQLTPGTFTDSNGKGLFKYEPPSGFLALCEDNLPTPAIADPGDYFKTVLYTGSGTYPRNIVGVGFTPDLVWVKNRNNTDFHRVYDSVRGAKKAIYTNATTAEQTDNLISFDLDGFTFDTDSYGGGINDSGEGHVAWCWRAGGAAVSNTDGSITSQVSANQTAGFSIVSYTGNATSGATVGHGLAKTPKMVIVKERTPTANNWPVYHASLGNTKAIYLDLPNDAGGTFTGAWNNTTPTSSLITLGNSNETNRSGSSFIAYCWAEIEGFSKFGSYTGNGSTDGPFVYCGFKPAFLLTKCTSTANGHWILWDSSRTPTNLATTALTPNNSWADTTGFDVDLLSNGFKQRDTETSLNLDGETYIFAAFAESPFQTANSK
jgi:hypothetical protein